MWCKHEVLATAVSWKKRAYQINCIEQIDLCYSVHFNE